MNYDKLINHGFYYDMFITDANNAYDFFGINDYVDKNDQTIDVVWDTNRNIITVKKYGLNDLELLLGKYGD